MDHFYLWHTDSHLRKKDTDSNFERNFFDWAWLSMLRHAKDGKKWRFNFFWKRFSLIFDRNSQCSLTVCVRVWSWRIIPLIWSLRKMDVQSLTRVSNLFHHICITNGGIEKNGTLLIFQYFSFSGIFCCGILNFFLTYMVLLGFVLIVDSLIGICFVIVSIMGCFYGVCTDVEAVIRENPIE